MKTFDITWFLYNPKIDKRVSANNSEPLQAESLKVAMGILNTCEPPDLFGGIKCTGFSIKERE